MRRALAVITTVGALAVGGSAYASQATGKSAQQNTRTPAAQTSQVTGTLTNFDSASNTMTLSTLNGEETFTIGPTAMLHQGRKVLMTSDLANLTGHNATVRYAESAGQRMVDTVDVSRRGSSSKSAATSGTAKKQPAPAVAQKSGGN